ncbi:hypothetical protein GCM10009504_28660 [Pseudomonas laurentiana]|nr:hypothetical protein GCM10009504_28660 [Pseudomonas laurentiana]
MAIPVPAAPQHRLQSAPISTCPESLPISACQAPIIVALDFPSRDATLKLADQLGPKMCWVKVGKELFTSSVCGIVEALCDMFLDLKFHDI